MRALPLNLTGFGFLAPFEVVSFRWAWGGLACSVFSDQAEAALQAVVALNLVGSASGWAAILTAQAVPRLLLIVAGGIAADRVHLQLILRAGNALQAAALVSIAALDHSGMLNVPYLYAFAIVYGSLAAFTAPATDSLMPSLLPLELVRRGNALRSLALNVGARLTQSELAERAGLSARGVQDLERGIRRTPHPDTVRRLATALGLAEADRLALVGGVQPAPAAPLPLSPNPLIGREAELLAAHTHLRDEYIRLLTLTGVGGTGKTRLALEVAEQLRDDFGQQVHFVDRRRWLTRPRCCLPLPMHSAHRR